MRTNLKLAAIGILTATAVGLLATASEPDTQHLPAPRWATTLPASVTTTPEAVR